MEVSILRWSNDVGVFGNFICKLTINDDNVLVSVFSDFFGAEGFTIFITTTVRFVPGVRVGVVTSGEDDYYSTE